MCLWCLLAFQRSHFNWKAPANAALVTSPVATSLSIQQLPPATRWQYQCVSNVTVSNNFISWNVKCLPVCNLASDGPVWNLERRKSSGHLFWSSTNTKVKFLCDVEVKEYIKDPNEHRMDYMEESQGTSFEEQVSYSIVVCATCVAAVAVTVFLPWLLIGSTWCIIMVWCAMRRVSFNIHIPILYKPHTLDTHTHTHIVHRWMMHTRACRVDDCCDKDWRVVMYWYASTPINTTERVDNEHDYE